MNEHKNIVIQKIFFKYIILYNNLFFQEKLNTFFNVCIIINYG